MHKTLDSKVAIPENGIWEIRKYKPVAGGESRKGFQERANFARQKLPRGLSAKHVEIF